MKCPWLRLGLSFLVVACSVWVWRLVFYVEPVVSDSSAHVIRSLAPSDEAVESVLLVRGTYVWHQVLGAMLFVLPVVILLVVWIPFVSRICNLFRRSET